MKAVREGVGPAVEVFVCNQLEHVAVADRGSDTAEPLIHGPHRAVENVVQRQREPVCIAIAACIASVWQVLTGRHAVLLVWVGIGIYIRQIHGIIWWWHVGDVLIVGHWQGLYASKGVLGCRRHAIVEMYMLLTVLRRFIGLTMILCIRRLMSGMFTTLACRGLNPDEGFPQSCSDGSDEIGCLKAQVDIIDNATTE